MLLPQHLDALMVNIYPINHKTLYYRIKVKTKSIQIIQEQNLFINNTYSFELYKYTSRCILRNVLDFQFFERPIFDLAIIILASLLFACVVNLWLINVLQLLIYLNFLVLVL